MEVLTSKNRMSATKLLSLYLANMLSPDYSNGLAITQYPEDSFITHCLASCLLLLCTLPLITYFKSSNQRTFVCIENIIKRNYFYITYIFDTSYGLYIIWEGIKQLQLQDQHDQQVRTGNSLVQTSPPPGGTANTALIHGTYTISSGFATGLSGI